MNIESGVTDSQIDSGEKIKTREQIHSDIIAKIMELGILECPEEIIDRLTLIGEYSEFNLDSEMVCEAFGNVLSVFEKKNPNKVQFTPKQKQEGLLASFLHDIGKAGPLSASQDCRLSIIRLFSIKDFDVKRFVYVGDALRNYFPDDYQKILEDLKEVGVGQETTMRAFWNNHAWWTHDILQKYPDQISQRVDLIASSHHISDGENPCKISEEDVPSESLIIGTLEHYVDFLEERMLMVIDKYQAALMRPKGGATHQDAMSFLHNFFSKRKGDPITDSIIEIIDDLGKSDSLFPNTKNKYNQGH